MDDKKYVKLGNRLKMLREQSGFKQGQFADKIGITRQSMSNYESGKHCPNADVLKRMADCLECSVDFLVGATEHRTYERQTITQSFGKRLKALMKSKNMKQHQLAGTLRGVSKQSINAYVSDRTLPSIEVIVQIADLLDCSVDYLLGRDTKISLVVKDSRLKTLGELDQALSALMEDEGNYIVDGITSIINSLSISKANPERKNFIELLGKLLNLLSEYIDVSTERDIHLRELNRQGTLTSEVITVTVAQFYGYDDIDKLIEEIKRTGLNAAVSFSVNAKKELRIRTGWRQSRQEGKDNENDIVEPSS